MNRHPAIIAIPESIGLSLGACSLAFWKQSDRLLSTPSRVLLLTSGLGFVSGFLMALIAAFRGENAKRSVQLGSQGAVFGVVAASACLLLMARSVPHSTAVTIAFVLCLAAAMPGVFTGTIGAGIGSFVKLRNSAVIHDEAESRAAPPSSAAWCKICCRGAITLLVLGALFLPRFVPTVEEIQERERISQMAREKADAEDQARRALEEARHAEEDQESNREKVPAAPRFSYQMPEGLKTARPVAWQIQTQRSMENVAPANGFAISNNQKFIAVLSAAESNRILIHELNSDTTTTLPALPFRPGEIAFNPTGDKLAVVSDEEPRQIGLLPLHGGSFILLPQPNGSIAPEEKLFWFQEKEILFFESLAMQSQALNLDTLQLRFLNPSPEEAKQIVPKLTTKLPRNEQGRFERGAMPFPNGERNQRISFSWPLPKQPIVCLADLTHSFSRAFPQIEYDERTVFAGTADGSKLLRFQGDHLTIFYFTTRPVPPLRWKLTMPHGPDKLNPAQVATQALQRGDLAVNLYAPVLNPLNRQPIGADRTRIKATLRFTRWEGTEAEVCVFSDYAAHAAGDIFADLHSADANEQLFTFEQSAPWWMPAPEPLADAADATKLPLLVETHKQWREALEQNGAMEADPSKVQEIKDFVIQHHRKASERRLREMAEDYDERVDYFDKGVVNRAFIFADESEYHAKYRSVREDIDGEISVRALANGRHEARYMMVNAWQKASDGSVGGGKHQITLELTNTDQGWRIVKQRSEKGK